jgi:hypothetical protein
MIGAIAGATIVVHPHHATMLIPSFGILRARSRLRQRTQSPRARADSVHALTTELRR